MIKNALAILFMIFMGYSWWADYKHRNHWSPNNEVIIIGIEWKEECSHTIDDKGEKHKLCEVINSYVSVEDKDGCKRTVSIPPVLIEKLKAGGVIKFGELE